MSKLFLASEFGYSGNLLREKLKGFPKNPKVAYIANAADLDDDQIWMTHNREKFIDLGFEIIDVDLRVTQHDNLKEKLEQMDTVYVEGGNTFYLLDISNKSGFTKIIQDLVNKKNKLYIGTSAGSIVAGPNTESTKYLDDLSVVPNFKNFTGFGLVNFVVIPHIGNDDFYRQFEDNYFEMFKNLKMYDYPHICLRDNQAIWAEDNKIEIVQD